MSNTARGQYTVTIGGEEKLLKLGMNTFRILQERTGVNITDIEKGLSENPIQMMGEIVYAGLKSEHYSHKDAGQFDIHPEYAFTALDEMSMDQFEELAAALMKSMDLGNGKTVMDGRRKSPSKAKSKKK